MERQRQSHPSSNRNTRSTSSTSKSSSSSSMQVQANKMTRGAEAGRAPLPRQLCDLPGGLHAHAAINAGHVLPFIAGYRAFKRHPAE